MAFKNKSMMDKTIKSGNTGSTGSSTNTHSSTASKDAIPKQNRGVSYGRFVFIGFIVAVAGCMGYLAYRLLTNTETMLVNEQYYSLVERALMSTTDLTENKLVGATTMAKVAGYTFPNASTWPYGPVPGYYDIASSVVKTSIVGGLSLAPIVQPGGEMQAEFEEVAYRHYEDVFPGEEAAINGDFKKGIWAKNSSGQYHDTTGESDYGSPRKILVPKFQHSKGNHRLLLMNVHAFEQQGLSIDAALDCSENVRALSVDPTSINCQSTSDMVPPKDPTDPRGPGAFIATPVYPANEPTIPVAMIFAKMNWNEILDNIFPFETVGIDAVVETQYSVHTYTVIDGTGIYLGEGDQHDEAFDEFAMSTVVLNQTHLPEGSVSYTVTFYPNANLDDTYRTENPRHAAIGIVLVMFLTSVLFFLYDFFVRNEFQAKTNLLAAKRQFVRFVSHEVRTPLNSVCMGLTLLQEEIAMSLGYSTVEDFVAANEDEVYRRSKIAGKDQEWFHLAHEVQVNAQSSVDVLNDLLNYDKIESGSLMLELSVIPIWNLIEQTVNEFKLPAATKKINISLKLPKDKDTPSAMAKKLNQQKVVGDSVRITQILRNLVSNALKFTPENGSVHICAMYEPWKDGEPRTFSLNNREELTAHCSGKLIVNVKDTGAGMTKEQLKKLFGQGVQFNVNQLQAGNGSGLGLFIAKGIAEQHDGSLSCDSQGLGFGTTFTMTIPLYHIEDEEDDPELQAEKAKHVAEHQMHKLRILVVDDAATNRKLLVRLLQNRGHTCEQAEDGSDAVDIVKETENTKKCYDMILMDYEMPLLNGPEAAKEIRALGSDIFIVGITGNMMAEDVAYFKACGANAVLPKPIKMTALEDLCMEQDVENRNTPFLDDKSHRSICSSVELWASEDVPLDISFKETYCQERGTKQ